MTRCNYISSNTKRSKYFYFIAVKMYFSAIKIKFSISNEIRAYICMYIEYKNKPTDHHLPNNSMNNSGSKGRDLGVPMRV